MTNRTYHPRNQPVDGCSPHEHPLYHTWADMLARCYNPKSASWPSYGGRGISVCNRWHHFANFVEDMGPKPDPALTLERSNNSKGYGPGNCRWATRTEQCHNRRRFKTNTTGETGVVAVTKRITRYAARYDHGGRRYDLGRFDTVEEAAQVRLAFVGLFQVDREAALEMLHGETVWCTSSTGVRGVTRHADGGFLARTTVNKKRVYLGYFKTIDQAAAAVAAAKQRK